MQRNRKSSLRVDNNAQPSLRPARPAFVHSLQTVFGEEHDAGDVNNFVGLTEYSSSEANEAESGFSTESERTKIEQVTHFIIEMGS